MGVARIIVVIIELIEQGVGEQVIGIAMGPAIYSDSQYILRCIKASAPNKLASCERTWVQ